MDRGWIPWLPPLVDDGLRSVRDRVGLAQAQVPQGTGRGSSVAERPPSGRPGPTATTKPAPPLALQPPPEPSPIFRTTDLRKVPAEQLAATARQLYDDKQYAQAIPFLHYAIKGGADGGYDLACDYALVGRVDAAFYWI